MKKMSEPPPRPEQATVRLCRAARVEGYGFSHAAKTLSRFTPRKGAGCRFPNWEVYCLVPVPPSPLLFCKILKRWELLYHYVLDL